MAKRESLNKVIDIYFILLKILFIYLEREHEQGEGQKKRERESQADSVHAKCGADVELDLRIPRSSSEPKPRSWMHNWLGHAGAPVVIDYLNISKKNTKLKLF